MNGISLRKAEKPIDFENCKMSQWQGNDMKHCKCKIALHISALPRGHKRRTKSHQGGKVDLAAGMPKQWRPLSSGTAFAWRAQLPTITDKELV